MRYWDSSAIVPLCVEQSASPVARDMRARDPQITVSRLAVLECCSAFARLRREGVLDLDAEDAAGEMARMICGETATSIPVTQELLDNACDLLRRHPLRSADALQLASALIWADGAPDGLEFVCFDRRLRDAAATEGFAVLPADTDLL